MEVKFPFKDHNVCQEEPVDLILNGRKIVTFMCTPENLKELAIGYLYNRGLINNINEIIDIGVSYEIRKIFATIPNVPNHEEYGLSGVLTSGCGSATVLSEKLLNHQPIVSNFKTSLSHLKALATTMAKGAEKYRNTGGIHCAALANNKDILFLREDVGRHNAVDKVVGNGILAGINFSKTIVLTTGRISSDMILKALACGLPVVATRSVPTGMALEIADSLGITVVGRIFTQIPIVYTHGSRIYSSETESNLSGEVTICSGDWVLQNC